MATETLDDSFSYVPGTPLGRSGYELDKQTRLAIRIEQLDALLVVICASDDNEQGFSNCNSEIQNSVLGLASDLAKEVHELHEQTFLARMRDKERVEQ